MTDLANPISLASYIRPDDRAAVEGDADNIDRREGTCFAIEHIGPDADGVMFDLCHVVHVHHGTLRFGKLRADQVGSVSPPAPADLDSLIRLAGKHLKEHGRRSDDPYFAVVQVCRHALSLPAFQPDMPSVFGDDDSDDMVARIVCGTCGRPVIEGACPKHGMPVVAVAPDPVAALLARLDALDGIDHAARNEIRRQARTDGLAYLEDGAELTLADLMTYDVILTRWERHAARTGRVAS